MKCPAIRAMLLDDIENPNPEVQAHLKGCAECRQYATQMSLLNQRVRHHADHLTVPADAWQRLQTSIAAEPDNQVIYLDPTTSHPIIETLKSAYTHSPLSQRPALVRAFSALPVIGIFALVAALILMRPPAIPPAASLSEPTTDTPTEAPTNLPVAETAAVRSLKIGLVIDGPNPETNELGPNVEFCLDGSLNELHVVSSVAVLVYDQLAAAGHEVELFEQYDRSLPTFDGDGLIFLQTRGCEAQLPSGYNLSWNSTANDTTFAHCIHEQYYMATRLDHARVNQPFIEIDTPNHLPTVVIWLGALSADREILDHDPERIAAGLAAGVNCFAGVADAELAYPSPSAPAYPASDWTGSINYSANSGSEHGLYRYSFEESFNSPVWSDPDWYPIEADWREDGSQIVWSGYRVVNSPLNLDLFVISGEVFDATNTLVTPLVSLPGDDIQPEWSPDGTKVAFVSDVDDDKNTTNNEIFVVTVADGSIQRITYDEANDTEPTWSPDGLWIAYISDTDGSRNIYLATADGREGPYQVTRTADLDERTPDWSPDGRHILYSASASTREGAVYMLSLDNPSDESAQMLFQTYWPLNRPTWSPDGKHIAFIDLADGQERLYVINLDGTVLRELFITERALYPSFNWLP